MELLNLRLAEQAACGQRSAGGSGSGARQRAALVGDGLV